MAVSLFLRTAASPPGQWHQQSLWLSQVWRETGAGLWVSNEQGPPPVGHHHQPAGKKETDWTSGWFLIEVRPPALTDDIYPWHQAIMMSICLQAMVDELMVKKSGGSIKKVSAR